MSTNYYFHKNICPHCHKPDEIIHIGLSSSGWCFQLHIYPDKGISSLEDWENVWKTSKNSKIMRETGDSQTIDEMLEMIADRRGPDFINWKKALACNNNAAPGPNNLLRTKVDGVHTVGHGKGTWDLCIGEFC